MTILFHLKRIRKQSNVRFTPWSVAELTPLNSFLLQASKALAILAKVEIKNKRPLIDKQFLVYNIQNVLWQFVR